MCGCVRSALLLCGSDVRGDLVNSALVTPRPPHTLTPQRPACSTTKAAIPLLSLAGSGAASRERSMQSLWHNCRPRNGMKVPGVGYWSGLVRHNLELYVTLEAGPEGHGSHKWPLPFCSIPHREQSHFNQKSPLQKGILL